MSEPANLVYVTLDKIFPNPFQKRTSGFDGPEFDALVESIRVDGLQQPPPARPFPDRSPARSDGAVQLKAGHRRLKAWSVARPNQPFPVILGAYDDRQMFEGGAIENIQRENLTDIERAQLVKDYIERFRATQVETARIFKLKDPASVSNLLKLLKLPAAIQEHVASDRVPQAIARNLVGVANINPKTAQKIADAVAAAPPSEKAEVFQHESRDLFYRQMIDLDQVDWDDNWPTPALSTDKDLGDGDHLLPPCYGCVFNVAEKCARRTCFDEKFRIWASIEAQRVAGEKKLHVVHPGEKVLPLFNPNNYDYGAEGKVRALLAARSQVRDLLRIAPRKEVGNTDYWMRQIFDSRAITLVTIDKAKIGDFFKEVEERKTKPKASKSVSEKPETDAQRAKRIVREEEEANARRAERSAKWRSYYDALWLMEHAAFLISERINIAGAFVEFVEEEFCSHHHARDLASKIEHDIEEAIENESGPEQWRLRVAHLALNVIADSSFIARTGEHAYSFEETHQTITDLLEGEVETFGVQLPTGWDKPPVHHTSFNCWYCGCFAGNTQEKLTKRDINIDGWIDDGKDGVFDSEAHKLAYLAANANATSNKPVKKAKRELSPSR